MGQIKKPAVIIEAEQKMIRDFMRSFVNKNLGVMKETLEYCGRLQEVEPLDPKMEDESYALLACVNYASMLIRDIVEVDNEFRREDKLEILKNIEEIQKVLFKNAIFKED